MKARRFGAAGLEAFRAFVVEAKRLKKAGQAVPAVPAALLTQPEWSSETAYELPERVPEFRTKRDIGRFICGVVPAEHQDRARSDAGLFSWLAANYFDAITHERQKIKEPRAYLAGLSFQEFYRHLLLGPFFIYSMAQDDPERVKVLLYDEPTTMNEVMVQFGSYQTLMQNPELQTVIQRLYFDEGRGRIKIGAGGKGGGSPRRLMDFLRQIELNYDLPSIEANRVWNMLPREFSKYMQVGT